MRVTRLRVENFVSYKDTDWIELAAGINIIVGQNDAGKSALLRALEFPMPDIRHLSAEQYRSEQLLAPKIEFDIAVAGTELEEAILQRKGHIQWPIQSVGAVAPNAMLEWLRTLQLQFQISRTTNKSSTRRFPSHGLFTEPPSYFVSLIPADGRIYVTDAGEGANDNIMQAVDTLLSRKLFLLNAQRYSIAKAGIGRAERLTPSAGNLPLVLSFLQGERRGVFRKLAGHLREVFSTVGDLSVAGTLSNELNSGLAFARPRPFRSKL